MNSRLYKENGAVVAKKFLEELRTAAEHLDPHEYYVGAGLQAFDANIIGSLHPAVQDAYVQFFLHA